MNVLCISTCGKEGKEKMDGRTRVDAQRHFSIVELIDIVFDQPVGP